MVNLYFPTISEKAHILMVYKCKPLIIITLMVYIAPYTKPIYIYHHIYNLFYLKVIRNMPKRPGPKNLMTLHGTYFEYESLSHINKLDE